MKKNIFLSIFLSSVMALSIKASYNDKLHSAVSGDDLNSLLEIIAHSGDVLGDVNTPNNSGKTPLHLAESPIMADCLVRHGAEVDAVDCYARSALFYAARNNNEDLVRLLIFSGADERSINQARKQSPSLVARVEEEYLEHLLNMQASKAVGMLVPTARRNTLLSATMMALLGHDENTLTHNLLKESKQ